MPLDQVKRVSQRCLCSSLGRTVARAGRTSNQATKSYTTQEGQYPCRDERTQGMHSALGERHDDRAPGLRTLSPHTADLPCSVCGRPPSPARKMRTPRGRRQRPLWPPQMRTVGMKSHNLLPVPRSHADYPRRTQPLLPYPTATLLQVGEGYSCACWVPQGTVERGCSSLSPALCDILSSVSCGSATPTGENTERKAV